MSAASAGASRFGRVAVSRATSPTQPAARPPRKYTILLSADLADALDADTLALQRTAGRRVDKSEVIRQLVGLLQDDPALLEQVRGLLSD